MRELHRGDERNEERKRRYEEENKKGNGREGK